MSIKNKKTFKHSYNLELDNNRCSCGPGSDGELVKKSGTIEFINNIIKKYKIKSISDCPCGLFENWMRFVDLTNVKYTGYDINDLAIERNKKNNPDLSFFEFDIVDDKLPYADLVICRDCLFHLPDSFVLGAIENFYNSGSAYLLATDYSWVEVNTDLTKEELELECGFRFINLEIKPFNLGSTIEIHNEEVWREYEGGHNRQMALWRLKEK